MKILRSGCLAAALLASLATAATASASTRTCNGLPVTIEQATNDQITDGTNRADVILLHHAGTVRAGAGDDIICGSRGPDVIDAGSGSDVVIAGRGRDTITAGNGADRVFGEGGGDTINGGAGRDFILGGDGVDRVARQGGDVVASGRFGVSIVLPIAAIEQILAYEQQLVLTRAGTGAVPVTATTYSLLPQLAFAFSDYAAFTAGQFPPPMIGTYPQLNALTTTAPGNTVTFQADGTATETPGGATNAITIGNNGPLPLTVGLAQYVSSSTGAPAWGAIQVGQSQLPTYVQQPLIPGNQVWAFTSIPVGVNQLLDGVPQGAQPATFSVSQPTATFTWDNGTGTIVPGQSW